MTDSMKFGPEWLRNMSSDNSGTGSGSGGGSGTNSNHSAGSGGGGGGTSMGIAFGPRFQQAEFRYGREEMLSLCEKEMKLPEILPSFKKLFVEKEQLPLALSPSTEDDSTYQYHIQSRPWNLRSPVAMIPPPRGGRGGSVDRGRGRSRIGTSLSFPARPPYDDPMRVSGGKILDRGWPERNGGGDLGAAGDWASASPSSSPRKEYNSSHGRGSTMENWRRSRVDDDTGEGWRSSTNNSGSSSSSYRWSRSTSWRDEETSNQFLNSGGGIGSGGMVPITRSFSSSASVGHISTGGGGGGMDRSNMLHANDGMYRSLAHTNNSNDGGSNATGDNMGDGSKASRLDSSGPSNGSSNNQPLTKSNAIWDQEDIPEWAMENTADGGGSFDASGAFHVPNDEDPDGGGNTEARSRDQRRESVPEGGLESTNGQKQVTGKIKPTARTETDRMSVDTSSDAAVPRKRSIPQAIISSSSERKPQPLSEVINVTNSSKTMASGPSEMRQPDRQPKSQDQISHTGSSGNVTTNLTSLTDQSAPKNNISDLADRMQEVADDMVEKLIMEDEVNPAASTLVGANSTQVPLMKSVVTSNSPTGSSNAYLQRPIQQVHAHPMIVPPPQSQPPPAPNNELWFYRDPQHKIQGPFTGTEMAEWYRADYFDESLFVRRVCDSRFATLGELVKMCGNSMPFLVSHLIPPLQITPVMSLVNQPGNVLPPGAPPVNVNPTKPINIVNPMLNSNEMANSLNLQLQYLQKEYLLRQQNLIFSKLSSSEQFALLSPERQQQILQQQMTQVSFPDNIVNLTAFVNFLHGGVSPSPYSMQQQLMATSSNNPNPPKTDLGQVKMGSANPFVTPGGGRPEFPVNAPLHNLMQAATPGQTMVQQHQPPPPPPQHQNAVGTDDRIKTLLRHLQTSNPQNIGNAFPQNVMPGLQQMSWPPSAGGAPTGPASMWDFDPITAMNAKIHAGIKPEMKTEQQILEEQRLHQQQQHQQQHHQQHNQQQLQGEKQQHDTQNMMEDIASNNQQQSSQIQPVVPQHISYTQAHVKDQQSEQTIAPPPQHAQQHQQLQNRASKKSDDQKSKTAGDDTSKHPTKVEEAKKSSKGNKTEKKEPSKSQKQSDEDRRREATEERRKQKEEKKRQLQEEEKKRQQQLQEEEKRRQMLEEKKRQEEIDRHRRAKMLENAPPKATKQSGGDSGPSRSSVAPWSNSSLPGITTPAASLAEIQKAERERRIEERMEQINQRKIQQTEVLSKVEPALTWNAPAISVKSLAEIQAEEQKQQLAFEHSVTTTDQRRKKEDLGTLQSGQFFSGSSSNTGPTATASQNTTLGSIWSSWNGKPAWSSTSSAGFWEEPAKIPATSASGGSSTSKQGSYGLSVTGGNSGNRILTKSQTFSNIQTSAKMNQPQNSSGDGVKNVSNSMTGTVMKQQQPLKGSSTSLKSGKSSSSNNNNSSSSSTHVTFHSNVQKDDARNEFTSWCIKTLSSMKSNVDVPTFIQFLEDIESPYEVKDYIRTYLGETKECSEFAKQFLERRSKYKNQQRAQNAHIDDMCSPAPAINPSNDFQEVKGKAKKVKKGKMTKLDAARILGFSVTAAQDRINVGDRDYGDAS